jgi:RND family efflux transporter MFP subunit
MRHKLPILFLLYFISLNCNKEKTIEKYKSPYLPVEVYKIKKTTFHHTISIPAEVLPMQKAALSSKIPGKIIKIPVKEGEIIKKGTRLVIIDRSDYLLRLKQAKANLKIAKANIKQAELNLNSIKVQHKRITNLYSQKAVPKSEFDKINDGYKQSQTRLELAKAQLELAKVGLETAQMNLSNTIIKAPFDGVVIQKFMNEGEIIRTMPPSIIMVLMDISKVKIQGTITEQEYGYVQKGMPVKISLEAIPNKIFKTKIERINPLIDPKTRTAKVQVILPNPLHEIQPGMSAEMEIEIKKRDSLALPRDAIIINKDIGTVFVIRQKKTLQKRSVKLGMINNKGLVEITKGLALGELVVRSIQAKMTSGMKVTIIPSGKSKP